MKPNVDFFYALRVISPILTYLNLYRTGTTEKDRSDCAGQIYDLIQGYLRGYIFSRIVPSAAEDVLQVTAIAIVENLQKCRAETEDGLQRWYRRIAFNKIKDHLRRKYSDRTEALPPDDILKIVDRNIGGFAPVSASERMDLDQLLKLLEQQKPGCRKLILDHHVIGWGHTELAKELGWTPAAVRMRIKRCIKDAKAIARRLK